MLPSTGGILTALVDPGQVLPGSLIFHDTGAASRLTTFYRAKKGTGWVGVGSEELEGMVRSVDFAKQQRQFVGVNTVNLTIDESILRAAPTVAAERSSASSTKC